MSKIHLFASIGKNKINTSRSQCGKKNAAVMVRRSDFISIHAEKGGVCTICLAWANQQGIIVMPTEIKEAMPAPLSVNAKTQIIENMTAVFETAWQKERVNLRSMLERFNETKKEVYSVTGDCTRNYNNISKKVYAIMYRVRPLFAKIGIGVDVILELERYGYFEGLTAKINNALSKFNELVQTNATDIQVSTSPKGFTVRVKLDNGQLFKTECVLAGGYNIQCYHYRYISSLS